MNQNLENSNLVIEEASSSDDIFCGHGCELILFEARRVFYHGSCHHNSLPNRRETEIAGTRGEERLLAKGRTGGMRK